jgi:hypothetical protein
VLEDQLRLERAENARLLRMVEMVVEERFYRPNITHPVTENAIAPGLPIESLSDVAVFDESTDRADVEKQNADFRELEREVFEIEAEHRGWRAEKGLANEENPAVVSAA